MSDRYSTYGGSSSSSSSSSYDDDDEVDLTFTPHAAVGAYIDRVFGTSADWGQSLGVAMEDVDLLDGTLYIDPDSGKYKVFSWENVSGLSPMERYERDQTPSADDAPEIERKTYGSNSITYELVAARVEPIEDDGEMIVEEDAKVRDVDVSGDSADFGEWEETSGAIRIGDTITWMSGSDEYGPSTSSRRCAQLLTQYGEDALEDEDDLYNWLTDTSGDNILRNDLKGRRVEFFIDIRESENGRNYHYPVVIDASTGTEIGPNNTDSASKEDSPTNNATVPEPVGDFIQSGQRLDIDHERAESLLNELIEEPGNALNEQMVEDFGGREALIEEAI